MNAFPPRRSRQECRTDAERKIIEAMAAVEDMPANELLTEAVILLERAFNNVADYVDDSGSVAKRVD